MALSRKRGNPWMGKSDREMTCVRCLKSKPVDELDRLLWCEECVAKARHRATRRGWMAGAVLALFVALYILFWIQPDFSLIPAAWVAVVVVALYLGSRAAREIFFGWERILNRRAVEATPPEPGSLPKDDTP